MIRRAEPVPAGSRRTRARGLLALGVALLLPGCVATRKHVEMIETDVTRQSAWNDERFQRLGADLEAVRAENEALRLRMDDLADQITALGGEVSARLTELARSDQEVAEQARQAARSAGDLDARRQKDREELMGQMRAILEEVVAENRRLTERIESLENSAFVVGRMHKVQKGESVASIASRYGVTPEEIIAANGLSDANLIQVGQELLIPGVSR